MDPFKDISMDVRQLISISEKISSTVLRGRPLTHDETEIVRQCTTQLLGLTKIGARQTENVEKLAHSSTNSTL